MKITLPAKWIENATAGEAASDVALETLQNRLGAVFELLPLAATKPDEDVEYIHQLRVWTRRAVAALTLYEDLMPQRTYSWMKKQLKRIRKAANYARDCDILLERLSDKDDVPGVTQRLEETRIERQHAQRAVVAVFDRMSADDRAHRVDELLQAVRERGQKSNAAGSICFKDWARKRLRPIVDKFFRAVPHDKTDVTAMHQFRIRGKKLRYIMELLPSAFPEEFRTRLYSTVESMQDRLGEINDLATSKVRLQQKLEVMSEGDADTWRNLMEREQSRCVDKTQQFWSWCTAERLQELDDGFDAMLGESTEFSSSKSPELISSTS